MISKIEKEGERERETSRPHGVNGKTTKSNLLLINNHSPICPPFRIPPFGQIHQNMAQISVIFLLFYLFIYKDKYCSHSCQKSKYGQDTVHWFCRSTQPNVHGVSKPLNNSNKKKKEMSWKSFLHALSFLNPIINLLLILMSIN